MLEAVTETGLGNLGLTRESGHAGQCVGFLPSRRASLRHNVFARPL